MKSKSTLSAASGILVAAAALLAGSTSANAATILIDWANDGTALSVTNPAGDGKYWNSIGGSSAFEDIAATALIDSTGAASSITVAVDIRLDDS